MEYKFYVKASPDNKSLGDCPFTHRANLALKVKGIQSVTLILIDLTNKPEWYKKLNPSGSVPALEFGDRIITDSYDIMKYLDETYPDPPMEPASNKEAEDITGQLLSVFLKWIKHEDESKQEEELQQEFTTELQKINDYMGKHSWQFLCSDQWSLADCTLVPRLYIFKTVAEHFKSYDKFEQLPNLKQYMDFTFDTDEFKATDYPKEYIIQGWGAKYFNK